MVAGVRAAGRVAGPSAALRMTILRRSVTALRVTIFEWGVCLGVASGEGAGRIEL